MLILNRNREAEHYNIGVTGTTGAGMIHCMGAHDGNGASNGNGNYISWSNGGTSSYPVTTTGSFVDGFQFVVWAWTDQSVSGTDMHAMNATPSYNQNGLTADQLYTQLQLARDGNWGTYAVWAISSHGYITSSSSLLSEMQYIRSQYWLKNIGSSTSQVNKAYAAIGTSHHGIIAESLDGRASSAFCEYHFGAMDHDKIGYAGYGRDYTVGAYMKQTSSTSVGTTSLLIQGGNVNNNTSSASTFFLREGESIRLTGECKVEDDSLRTGGSLVFTLGQSGATASTYTCTSNEWQPFEIYYTKPVGNSNAITLSTTYTAGTTTDGNGFRYRAISVHRCGFGVSAAAQTDQVLGGHTLTCSDIVESIGPFKLGKSGDFINFWNSSRNLYNPFFANQHNPASNSEATRFFDVNHNGSSPQSDAQRVFKMCDNGPNSNMTHSFYIPGTSSQFETVDHTKMYFAAFWVRVHSMGFSTSIAPSRIEVLAHAKNSTNNDVNMDKADGTTMASNKEMAFMSVSGGSPAQGVGNDTIGWKLYGGWFLPSWMTDSEIAAWKTDYWQKWAGAYNQSTSSADSGYNGATGELVASDMAYLARMNSAVAKIQLELSFQLHTSVPINARVAYPFMLEVDPMNFTEDGRAFFWEFIERQVPAL